jgi:hypothetical protein
MAVVCADSFAGVTDTTGNVVGGRRSAEISV